MTASILRRLFQISVTGGVLAAAVAVPPLWAADASEWASAEHSAARLIAGSRPVGETDLLRAGVEVKLATGWKTYWRYPGDSGVPPRFDFTQSRNVESVTVAWPAPQRFADSGGQVIGYKDSVVLPLRIRPADPSQGVELDLRLDYAICDKLCIPVEAEMQLHVDGSASTQDEALAAAEKRIPRPVKLGEGTPAITAIGRDGSGRVVVDVAASPGMAVDLFVEGPTDEWALPLPEPVSASGGGRRFAFDLDGLPSGARADGATLRFTLVSPTGSVEVMHALR
jgi:DsbC/DsbD-like thiol-disulfide interchange protein